MIPQCSEHFDNPGHDFEEEGKNTKLLVMTQLTLK